MNGFDITQKVYTRLRKPSDLALPYQNILDAASEVVASKKLDLSLSNANPESKWTDWFQMSGGDYTLPPDVFLPLKVKRREYGGYWSSAPGTQISIVSFESDADYGVSFYGSPLKMTFRGRGEYSAPDGGEYRISYQPDFGLEGFDQDSDLRLPAFFSGMIADETEFKVIDQVEDSSPEWMQFMESRNRKLPMLIAEWQDRWRQYVRTSRGKGHTLKRTMFDRGSRRVRPRFY